MCLHVERNSMIQETHIEEDLARWNLNSPHLQRTAPQSPGVIGCGGSWKSKIRGWKIMEYILMSLMETHS